MRRRTAIVCSILSLSICAAPALAGNSNYFIEGNPAGKRVSDAQSEINRTITNLRRTFAESSEFQQARDAVGATRRAYQSARDDALATLRTNGEYLRTSNRIQQLEQKLIWGSYDDRMKDAERAQVAAEVFALRSSRSAMEAKALSADESVERARFTMMDANGKLIALTRSFNESIRTSPAYLQAKSHLDAAIASR